VLRLEGGERLIFEPRMTGLVLVADPPTQEHLRLRLDLARGPIPHIWYWDRRGLGSVRLLTESQFAAQLGNGHLGPDALAISPGELRARLGQSRRPIKVALLDQRAVAGIAICINRRSCTWRVHPAKRTFARRSTVGSDPSMLAVLHLAIRYS
jgi:formamidopyrimidine-DNA glycosylase